MMQSRQSISSFSNECFSNKNDAINRLNQAENKIIIRNSGLNALGNIQLSVNCNTDKIEE